MEPDDQEQPVIACNVLRHVVIYDVLHCTNDNRKHYIIGCTIPAEGAVDDALDKLVLYPLHKCIYRCLVVDYVHSGQMNMMEEAIVVS